MQMDISQSRIWYISLKWCVLVGIMAVVLGCFVVRGCCRVLCHPHLELYAMNWGVIMSTVINHLLRFVSVISTVASRGWLWKRRFLIFTTLWVSSPFFFGNVCPYSKLRATANHIGFDWFPTTYGQIESNFYIYIYIYKYYTKFQGNFRDTPRPMCVDVVFAFHCSCPNDVFFSRVLKPQFQTCVH